MNPFERWDDWEWERAAQELGRDYRYRESDRDEGRRYYFNERRKDFLEILNGSQKRVLLSALLFLTIVFSARGEDLISQNVYAGYRNGMDSGNLYTVLNSMAKEAMGLPGADGMKVNSLIQAIFYPPVAGKVRVGFEGKDINGEPSRGIEIESSLGTPVLCPEEGVVLEVGQSESLGRTIKIDFGNGWVGILGNLGDILVKQGDPVTMGYKLGTVGINSARQKTWLYFELLKNGQTVNPLQYLIQSE